MTDWPRRALRPTPGGAPLCKAPTQPGKAPTQPGRRQRRRARDWWQDSCPAVISAGERYVRLASVTRGRATLLSISFQEGALTESEALVRPTVSVSLSCKEDYRHRAACLRGGAVVTGTTLPITTALPGMAVI